MGTEQLIILILVCGAGFVTYKLLQFRSKNKELLEKYSGLVDVDGEIAKRRKEATELETKYQEAKKFYDEFHKQVELYKDDLELFDFGLYTAQYSFDTSEEYKAKLDENRAKQKESIKEKKAIKCSSDWEVQGSKRKGQQMIKRYKKLMLRAFNGEADSAVAKVKWNNETRMEERIKRAFDALNKLGESMNIFLQNEYLELKLQEIRLTHEYHRKKYEEKEEQRLIREQMREEERAQKELEKEKKDAEAQERQYEKALEKARKELKGANAEEVSALEGEIVKLQQELTEAQKRKERAVSRAQLTRSGHVYVVSNIGSFGENVYKMGMTRRLDPADRVKELGDASVPFSFDCHAMIYSEDAPSLETKLHQVFTERRVNLVNTRKEFFNVELNEIEKVVRENHGEFEITRLAEAQEYRETQTLRNQKVDAESSDNGSKKTELPDSLFGTTSQSDNSEAAEVKT